MNSTSHSKLDNETVVKQQEAALDATCSNGLAQASNAIEGTETLALGHIPEPFAAALSTPQQSEQQAVPVKPAELLLKAAARQGHKIPKGTEQLNKLLTNLTHLHLNGLGLEEVHSLKLCPKLEVLYLYDNCLTSISSLANSSAITHLYLHNNQLQSLQGLQQLKRLQKLYLQGNCLCVIDSLTAATRLEELHVADQRLAASCSNQQQQRQHLQQQHQPAGSCAADLQQGLAFELVSLQAVVGSLRVLNVAGCGIQDPQPLAVLHRLLTLDLSRNSISKLSLLDPVLQSLQRLRALQLRGNPCLAHEPKYKDYVILTAADSLAELDGETIPATHRAFLLNLHLRKMRAEGRPSQKQQPLQQQNQQHLPKTENEHGWQDPTAITAKQHALSNGHLQHHPREQQPAQLCDSPAATDDGQPASNDGEHGGLGSAECPEDRGLGLTGTSKRLHAFRALVRPTAAGGYQINAARTGSGSSHPIPRR